MNHFQLENLKIEHVTLLTIVKFRGILEYIDDQRNNIIETVVQFGWKN